MNIKEFSIAVITMLLAGCLLFTGCQNKNRDNYTASNSNKSVSDSLLSSSFSGELSSKDASSAEQENIATEDSAVSETTDFISSAYYNSGTFVDRMPKAVYTGIMYRNNKGELQDLSEYQTLTIETKGEWQLYYAIGDVVTDKDVTWSSSNPKMVSVDKNGMLKANLNYKYYVSIMATTDDGHSSKFNVMRTEQSTLAKPGEKISGITDLSIFPKHFCLSSDYNITVDLSTNQQVEMDFYMIGISEIITHLQNGKIITEYETYQEPDPFDELNLFSPELSWTSSDPSIASVDENGLVTLHSKGQILL